MPPIRPSIPNHGVRSFCEPEAYISVAMLNHQAKRYDVDDEVAVPRWAVFIMVFVPLSIFFLGVAIYYLNRNRRSGMSRMKTPVELEDLELERMESRGQRSTTTAPNLPELYWPGVFHPSPTSEATVFPGAGAQRTPQQPRMRFDKSLPDLPPHTYVEDAEDWETVAPMTRENTFNDAFTQHRVDQDHREKYRRDKERRDRDRREENERSLLEALDRRQQRDRNQRRDNPYELSPELPGDSGDSSNSHNSNKKSPPLHDMNPHVNESYARYRRYRLQSSDVDNDTDVILASDTNTMGPPTTATTSNTGPGNSNPFTGSGSGSGSQSSTVRSGRDRRRQELFAGGVGGGYDGDVGGFFDPHRDLVRPPQPARLAAERSNFVPPAVSGRQFPSDRSEMDNFTEAMITDDPFVSGRERSAYQRR
ncbi:hypothetical protein SLS55_003273 [Diplodia seriata]|uniref:Transmembrane protein n=1 Tax=Diplodia seriata TaxID=420778 RepID=A0ABR3CNK5_9PEZI